MSQLLNWGHEDPKQIQTRRRLEEEMDEQIRMYKAFEARSSSSSTATATAASAAGATGITDIAVPPTNHAYVPFEQSMFFINYDTSYDGNYLYQTYNYSTGVLSAEVDSGHVYNDYYLNNWYPSNDGYVLLQYVDDSNSDLFFFEYVGPDAKVVWTSEIFDWSEPSLYDYWIEGLQEDGQSSGLYVNMIYYNGGESGYDINYNWFYQGKRYTGSIEAVSNWGYQNYYSQQGVATFWVSMDSDGSDKIVRLGKGLSEASIHEVASSSQWYYFGDDFEWWWKNDWKPGYNGQKLNYDLQITYNDSNNTIAAVNFWTTGANPDWSALSSINTAIFDLTEGAVTNCTIDDTWISGDRVLFFLYDTDIDTRYQIILDRAAQRVVYAREYNTSYNYIGVADTYKDVFVISEWPNFSCEGDMFYINSGDNYKTTIIWADGSSEEYVSENGEAFTWPSIDAGGKNVSWLTVPYDQDDQVYMTSTKKNSGEIVKVRLGGFTSTPGDNIYVTVDWHYDNATQRPLNIIWNNDENSGISRVVAANLTGEFDITRMITIDKNNNWDYFNRDRGGYHVYDVKDGMVSFKTLNPVRLAFNTQFEIPDISWNYWTGMNTAYGRANQRIMFYDYENDTAYSISERGLTGKLGNTYYDGNNLDFSYSWSFDGGLVNLDTMQIVRSDNSDIYYNVCDGDSQVDRRWVWDCENNQIICINGQKAVRMTANRYTEESLYNDIYRWND